MRRTIEDVTWEELSILRDSPYEQPITLATFDRRERRAVRRLLAVGLLERSDDGLVRVTDAGAAQAAPLTIKEVDAARGAVQERCVLLRLASEVVLAAHSQDRDRVERLAVRLTDEAARRRRGG